MIKLLKNNLILITIFLASFFLYTYKLSTLPPGLNWDEAALGYNAYSILKTARDEHGTFLPLIFKSFGDYKPGAYIYITIPFVAIFGLNEFSTRLSSALAGSLAVVAIYLLTCTLFKNKKISLFSAIALAFMPWHLHFSRGAWETNLSLTFTTFALYFWVKYLKGNTKTKLYSSLTLALLSLLTYQSAKLITPLLFLATAIYFIPQITTKFKQTLSNKKDLIISLLLLLLTTSFYIYTFSSPAANRLNRLSIFNFQPQLTQQQAQITQTSPFLGRLFYSSQVELFRAISSRYLYHFSPQILFYKGGLNLSRESLPITGLLLFPDFALIILGLIFLARRHQQVLVILISWLLLSPLPAAFTLREYSPTRSLFMTIPLAILIAAGIYSLSKSKKAIFLPIIAIYIFYTLFSLQTYFQQGPRYLSSHFNYGYKQAIQEVKDYPADQVVFTDILGQPYIYYLFHTKHDPLDYQLKNDYLDQGLDVGKVGRVGNVSFQQFAASEMETRKDTLFIGSIGNIQNSYNLVQDHIEHYAPINGLNHLPIFRVIKTR